MLILQDILSQEIVQRLGWTLLHFIWQAAAVALILTIILRVLRKSTANLRYIIASLALVLIVLLPVITIKLIPVSQPLTAAHFDPATAPTVLPAVEMPEPETIVIAKPSQPESVNVVPAIPFKQHAVDTLEPALPYIVSGWLIGVFGLSIWHLGGWTQLQRLKRRMVKQVDSTLLNKLKVLTQKLKVKQTVRLMESALVQIPTVVGWLRPVILLPASALTGLSSEQLEAIIAHELAHIKRFDYLINILQTIVEILGFYHPAVWWVSHKIRAERENCCDDMAVSISGDRVSYAGALASMEEIRAARSKLAVAATGGNLFRRICRLLGKDSTDNTGLSWVPAATAILLIIALAIPTTLALTNKSDSLLTETETKVQVEDDIIIATAQVEESPAENIPPVPILATSPAPPDKDKAHVRINCFVVEVFPDTKIDPETLAEAKKILGSKISLSNSKIDVIMNAAVEAMNAAKNKSAENKRLTQDQYKAFIEMLDSKGYIKILMNPMIETMDGQTAMIKSAQHVPLQQITKASPEIEYVDVVDLIEITPHVYEDGHIILDVEASLGSRNIPVFEEPTIPVSIRSLSTRVRANPGETLILGGLTENPLTPEGNIKNTEKQAKEVLFILTPTIVKTDKDSEKKAESTHKLKLLGLAVAMYADDNDEILPHTLKEVKPYIRDEQVFNWILDNVEYFDKGKTAQRNAAYIPIAYDKTLLEKADGTNILSLDFSVRFVESEEFEKLDLKRAEILIETWFLAVNKDFIENINHNADSPEEAKDLFKLKSELLAAVDGSKNLSFIPPERNVSLLLKAVRAHKDSKVLAAPKVLCRENKTAKIAVMSNETYYIVGYTEPNNPSEKPQPILEKVEEGIALSLRPNLTPNKNIDMQFESVISQFLDSEERKFEGKAPYKPPNIQRTAQSTRYIAKNGQTLLFGGNKIADRQDGQTEQKDLLILITAHTIDSSEQDKPAQAKRPVVVEPTSSTTKVITPSATAQSRRVRPNDSELKKTKPATEQKPQMVQKIFKLKHHNSSQMGQIILPLVGEYGHISADERTNSLLVIDTAENLKRIEKIIAQFDVSVAEQTVQKSFKLKYRNPSQMARILGPLLTKTGHVSADESTGILLVIDTPENLKRIEKIIAAFDVLQAERTIQKFFRLKYYSPSQMAQILIPLLTKTGHISADENTGNLLIIDTVENLKRIELIITEYDVPKASQTVTEIFEIHNGDPVEIVEILKKLINGRPDTASVIKPDTASVIESSNGPILLIPEPKRKWIIAKGSAENINQIGQWIKKLDIKKSTIGLDPIDEAVYEQLETIVDLSDLTPGMSFGEVIERLENSVEPPLQIQPIWKDLLDNAEVEQATPAGMDPLPRIKLRKALEILLTSVSSTGLPKLTYIVEEGIILIGTAELLPPKKVHRIYDTSDLLGTDMTKASPENIKQIVRSIDKHATRNTIGIDPIDKAVYEQLETIVDLSDLNPGTSFGEVVEKLENSVSPPLQIQPIWKDLLDNAEVEHATPASMDPLSRVKLCKALEILIAGVTSSQLGEFGEITYIVDEGVILIGTKGMLPPKMLHRVYHISDLIETAADANNLIHTITETIEPDSWYKLSAKGEGTIFAYPALKPRKFAVLQTYKIHQKIENFLGDMHFSRNELRSNQEYEQQPSQVQPKIPKLLDESEESMKPLEQIQKQLDELIKQREAPKVTKSNLPLAPKVKLISNTFIDYPLLDALQSIAAAANVTIIPDETITGLVSCTLKDVTVEMALDIILAGTPYVWKKTPHYYLVALGGVELLEIKTRMESAKILSNLGKALLEYANDYDDKYPDSLFTFSEYMKWQDFSWIRQNAEYLASGKTLADRPDTPIAYDKTLLAKGKGTNVLYNDFHVGFVKAEELKKLGISESEIMIETVFLSVSEDFLKDVGLDANTANLSDAWRGHLAAKYPAAGPNGQPYGLIIDDIHVTFLLRAVQAHNDSKAIVTPRVLTRAGTTAEMAIMNEEYYYIKGYNEPNSPSEKPEQKLDKVEIGTHLWLKPILTPDNKNVDLDFKLEMRQLKGIIEGKYKGKYPYEKPIVDVISLKMPCTIPDGKTMLIGGLKIIEHVTKKPRTPGLKDLPLIGGVFSGKDKIKDNKMLLILVKPITNPQQKATKILPGQEDSEEHIKRLAEQLDKKINPSAEHRRIR